MQHRTQTRRDVMLAVASAAAVAGCSVSRGSFPSASSGGTRAEGVAQIDAALDQAVSHGFAGVILLKQGGLTLLDKGYGLADPATRSPITPDTGFDIGSLVKPITAAAILSLESQGALQTRD